MNIEIKKFEKVLNPFNHELLSEELDNYITKECYINAKKAQTLNITGDLTKKEQDELTHLIHKHYMNLYRNLHIIDRYDDLIRSFALIIGITLLLISEQLPSLFSELFLIIGWVFIWEIMYDILFNQVKRKRKANIYKRLSKCEIIFN